MGGWAEGAEDVETANVGHSGGHEALMSGFASAPVAGFAHAQVLEMVDFAFDLRPIPAAGS